MLTLHPKKPMASFGVQRHPDIFFPSCPSTSTFEVIARNQLALSEQFCYKCEPVSELHQNAPLIGQQQAAFRKWVIS